jgi:thioredoxin reductase (NADPH)
MRENVNNHIRGLNWGYKKTFIQEGIKFYPKLASFIDNHTIKLVDAKGKEETVTANHVVIATGGRPTYLDVPGLKENCITSDDIFWQKEAPGKTLVLGAGYIALECGGFIRGMGHDVSILVRSVPLRNFDQDMVEKIVLKMEESGIKFFHNANPTSFEKLENGKILAKWVGGEANFEEEYDTILLATGRTPDLSGLNLPAVGVELKWDRVIVNEHHQTTADNIFAIGDIIVNSPELTPVAIREGLFLAEYLYNNGKKTVNYDVIATTIFTPLEYSCIGFSEEKAIAR